MVEDRYVIGAELTRDDIDSFQGATMLEFGTFWCGYCLRARDLIDAAIADDVRHIKIEDGSGKQLGRSFQVKRWPTLIFLGGGKEVARVVRPTNLQEIVDARRMIEPYRLVYRSS